MATQRVPKKNPVHCSLYGTYDRVINGDMLMVCTNIHNCVAYRAKALIVETWIKSLNSPSQSIGNTHQGQPIQEIELYPTLYIYDYPPPPSQPRYTYNHN
jgi:hypothetical protein